VLEEGGRASRLRDLVAVCAPEILEGEEMLTAERHDLGTAIGVGRDYFTVTVPCM